MTAHCFALRRLGNAVASGNGVACVAANGSGPGPIVVSFDDCEAGGVEISSTARVAGQYSISVMDASTGRHLSGSPLQVGKSSPLQVGKSTVLQVVETSSYGQHQITVSLLWTLWPKIDHLRGRCPTTECRCKVVEGQLVACVAEGATKTAYISNFTVQLYMLMD